MHQSGFTGVIGDFLNSSSFNHQFSWSCSCSPLCELTTLPSSDFPILLIYSFSATLHLHSIESMCDEVQI